MQSGLWIIILEMVLVLALGGFIVWWTMGARRRDDDRKPRDDGPA
jgi:flagellar basal body-associated protein FliL